MARKAGEGAGRRKTPSGSASQHDDQATPLKSTRRMVGHMGGYNGEYREPGSLQNANLANERSLLSSRSPMGFNDQPYGQPSSNVLAQTERASSSRQASTLEHLHQLQTQTYT